RRGDMTRARQETWATSREGVLSAQSHGPPLMRHLRMFSLHDAPAESEGIKVEAIHNERGYRRIRRQLARQYDVGWTDPNIEVVDVDLAGDRRLVLRHTVVNGSLLEETDAKRVLQHLADLWSYDVLLREIDSSDTVLKEHVASPRETALAA